MCEHNFHNKIIIKTRNEKNLFPHSFKHINSHTKPNLNSIKVRLQKYVHLSLPTYMENQHDGMAHTKVQQYKILFCKYLFIVIYLKVYVCMCTNV